MVEKSFGKALIDIKVRSIDYKEKIEPLLHETIFKLVPEEFFEIKKNLIETVEVLRGNACHVCKAEIKKWSRLVL